MKLIITFPHMEAEIEKAKPKMDWNAPVDWEQYEIALEKSSATFSKWYAIETAAMELLEETAFALAMERVRKETHRDGYYSDHIGLSPEYNIAKKGFEIEAHLLYPELIAALEDLQKLGSFNMHFEKANGEKVPDDWWHDEDELQLYNPFGDSNYDFDEKLAEASA